ncbi:MAG: hypothetical protein WCV90_04790 [Candidatus Woesearchaeota archaeon]
MTFRDWFRRRKSAYVLAGLLALSTTTACNDFKLLNRTLASVENENREVRTKQGKVDRLRTQMATTQSRTERLIVQTKTLIQSQEQATLLLKEAAYLEKEAIRILSQIKKIKDLRTAGKTEQAQQLSIKNKIDVELLNTRLERFNQRAKELNQSLPPKEATKVERDLGAMKRNAKDLLAAVELEEKSMNS